MSVSSIVKVDKSDCVVERVNALIRQMTLQEKVSLLSGQNDWSTMPVERLGIPAMEVCDGPHGVRLVNDGRRGKCATTAFPTGMAMACSWNTELMEQVGVALGEETKAMGCDILLGPAVNIIRHPLAGRNFECLSEDPYLSGRIGTAYIKGIQSRNTGTCLKHFACNNQETERGRGSSVVDERTMREIYLPAFEMAVKEAKPWTVMCAYNRINGVYASENSHLMSEILRNEWGFEGIVISDWGATHSSIESVTAGLDVEMPGPAKHFKGLVEAVGLWQIDEAVIDKAVARILRLIILSGKMDTSSALHEGSVCTPEHQRLARVLAEESMILLKNDHETLPLKVNRLKTIAAIGPNANDPIISGGGSSEIERSFCLVAPLDALRERLAGKVDVKFEEGCVNYVKPPIAPIRHFTPAKGSGHGLWGEYFNNTELSGEPVFTQVATSMNLWWGGSSPSPDIEVHRYSARWTGKLNVWHDASYTLTTWGLGSSRIYLDGTLILEATPDEAAKSDSVSKTVQLDLCAGKTYDFRMEYVRPESAGGGGFIVNFGVSESVVMDEQFNRAVELAKKSDVAIVFAGMSRRYEGEGADRADLDLPGRQNELISAVAKVNPNTIVVLNNGAAIAMPWLNEVAAVLEGLYYGQDGGNAIADILIGKTNPSGKLSVTFPKRLEDTPAFVNFPGTSTVLYGEEVFVGYRYYDKRDVEPLFPFGFGLSYTTFEYSDLKVPGTFTKDEPVEVTMKVKNSGKCEGKEVIQLYIHDAAASVSRPPRELKGFTKISLQPGQSKDVSFTLDQRAFSFYDVGKKCWMAEPGRFEVLVGSSSRDIKLKAAIMLVE